MEPIERATPAPAALWMHWELWLLVVLVAAIYLPRLTERPMRGEDSRRATIAYEMMDTGDWIVPRQQRVPYLSRPPLHSWIMAGLARITGDVDYLAIRLPSVLGVLGMVLVVCAVGTMLVGRVGGLIGGAAMASMPQVIEMGRVGETDAMFSFLVSASMLVWFVGYHRNWPRAWVWTLGYSLAALATLTKGIQALPYFAGATWGFLLWRRDWRWLFSWGHLAGVAAFAVVFGAWAVPFVRMMGVDNLLEVFRRDSRHQFGDRSVIGFASQMVEMPALVIGSTLPWIALLVAFVHPGVRRYAGTVRTGTLFVVIALAVAWPTVWLSPTSRNRHFMPLYPCLAVLVAIVAAAAFHRGHGQLRVGKFWRDYVSIVGAIMLGVAAFFGALAVPAVADALARRVPRIEWSDLSLPPATAITFIAGAVVLGIAALWACFDVTARRMRVGGLAIAAFLGLLMVGPVHSMDMAKAVDIRPDVARLRQVIGERTLVSYGETAHLFAYYYRRYIPIVELPTSESDLGAQFEYFCYYGGTEGIPEPKLPFAWEKVGQFNCDRVQRDEPRVLIVVGRRLDPPVRR